MHVGCQGQFVTIDEGDRTKRLTIGLGTGTSHLIARVQVYQVTEDAARLCAFLRAEDDRVEDGQNQHRENGGDDQARDDRDRHGDEERV